MPGLDHNISITNIVTMHHKDHKTTKLYNTVTGINDTLYSLGVVPALKECFETIESK